MRNVSIIALALMVGFAAEGARPSHERASKNNRRGAKMSSARAMGAAPAAAGAVAAPASVNEAVGSTISADVAASEAIAEIAGSDAAAAEIKNRFSFSYEKATGFCTGLSGQIDNVKVLAGVSTAASAVGTLSAGAAAVTGFMKLANDKKIGAMSVEIERIRELTLNQDELESAVDNGELAELLDKMDSVKAELAAAQKKSNTLGTVRTVGSFVAGGTSVVSAATSFVGAGALDKLVKDMNACDSYVREIKSQRAELEFVAASDPALEQMDRVIDGCSGLNSRNISDIKSKLTASGIVSAVGAATGIAGGVTSLMAGKREKNGALAAASGKDGGTKELNMASNVLAVATTATSLGSAVIGGVTLADLMKNGEVAEKCKAAF